MEKRYTENQTPVWRQSQVPEFSYPMREIDIEDCTEYAMDGRKCMMPEGLDARDWNAMFLLCHTFDGV